MQRFASVVRALAIASCIPLILIAAHLALTALGLAHSDALALDALASATSLALVAVAIAAYGRDPLVQRLGLGPGRLSPSRVALAALGLVGLSHAAEFLLQISGAVSPGLARIDEVLRGLPLSQIGFPFFALVIGAAFGEELFFRGLLQRGLLGPLGPAAAIGFAALTFGIVHGDLAHGSASAGLGVYLGILAWRADSTRAAMAAHALNNTVALGQVALELRVPEGPIATPLSLAVAMTLTCVGFVAMRGPAPGQRILQSPGGSAD